MLLHSTVPVATVLVATVPVATVPAPDSAVDASDLNSALSLCQLHSNSL